MKTYHKNKASILHHRFLPGIWIDTAFRERAVLGGLCSVHIVASLGIHRTATRSLASSRLSCASCVQAALPQLTLTAPHGLLPYSAQDVV
jgi:hypothetical protein